MMHCRECKDEHEMHMRRTVRGNSPEAHEIIVMRGEPGVVPYLWLEGCHTGPGRIVTVSGRSVLRRMALRETNLRYEFPMMSVSEIHERLVRG